MQFVLWATSGIAMLILSGEDIFKRRDADSCLLGFWLWGTFLFTTFFNWTINGRSVLPMTIPMGILIARRLEEQMNSKRAASQQVWIAVPLLCSAMLAIWVARADFLLAKAVRATAQDVFFRYGGKKGTVWFEGHWGFQYYMEAFGAEAVDAKNMSLKPGDYCAVPSNNANLTYSMSNEVAMELEKVRISNPGWLATANQELGAGFYSSMFGPLPFVFGRIPPEEVAIFVIKPLSSGTPEQKREPIKGKSSRLQTSNERMTQ